MTVKPHTLTKLEHIQVWWALEGELTLDLLTYYGACAAYGLWSGWVLGNWIVGKGWI